VDSTTVGSGSPVFSTDPSRTLKPMISAGVVAGTGRLPAGMSGSWRFGTDTRKRPTGIPTPPALLVLAMTSVPGAGAATPPLVQTWPECRKVSVTTPAAAVAVATLAQASWLFRSSLNASASRVFVAGTAAARVTLAVSVVPKASVQLAV
jgi:hypothetical protein